MHFFGRYIYSRNLQITPTQIAALAGKPTIATTGNDTRGDGVIGALNYAFNSTTNNVIRYGWIRSRIFLPGLSPSASAASLALPGTDSSGGPVALAPGLGTVGLLDVPIDVDTQRARTQGNFQRTKQLIDDFSKINGRHNIVAGGSIRWLPITAQRNDKVVGSLASLVALMDADGNGGASRFRMSTGLRRAISQVNPSACRVLTYRSGIAFMPQRLASSTTSMCLRCGMET